LFGPLKSRDLDPGLRGWRSHRQRDLNLASFMASHPLELLANLDQHSNFVSRWI